MASFAQGLRLRTDLNGLRTIRAESPPYSDIKTLNLLQRLSLLNCPRRVPERPFIQAGSLTINSTCQRRFSTPTETYRSHPEANYLMEAHELTLGLGISSRGILEMQRPDDVQEVGSSRMNAD
jgi:hypothetical protein